MNDLNNTIINLNKAINASKLSAMRFWAMFFLCVQLLHKYMYYG